MESIVVIGGTSGLGLAIALDLVAAGREVRCLSRSTGFDITKDWDIPDCDGLVISLRCRGDEYSEFETEVFGVAKVIQNLPSQCRNVVVVSSVAGSSIENGQPWHYHAAKASLEHLVRYYAVALGPVRINAVAPGLMRRDPTGKFQENNDFLASYLPLKEMVTEEMVSKMVQFLLTQDCPLTGQVLTVDAGASLLNVESLLGQVRKDTELVLV